MHADQIQPLPNLDAETWENTPKPAKPADANAGRLLGEYELLEEIARGGMGVVYRARQTRLDRIVALKMVLAGQLADPQDIQRFLVEATAAAGLDHPGIVPVYECGEAEGRHFFSMGYVEGPSLAARLAAGPLEPRAAAEILAQVADAIEYAHRRGVVHRDLKPSNILLDAQGVPRVADFGLAKRIAGNSELTRTGQALGTPSYMPPEQAAGKLDEIGPTSDVYALGAVLYSALTGRPPFQAASALDTLLQVLEREPVPPRVLNPRVPRDLETITLTCLEKEPCKRYPSADAFAMELRRYLDGKPIHARPIGGAARAWRWCRRNPVVAGLTLAVAVALVAGAATSAHFAVEANKRAADAEKSAGYERQLRDLADRDSYLAQMQLAEKAFDQNEVEVLADSLEAAGPKRAGKDFREFEWRYLWQCSHDDLLTLRDSKAIVNVAFGIDGRTLAVAGRDGAIDFYDSVRGGKTRAIDKGDCVEPVLGVAFSQDLRRVAEASLGDVRVRDTKTGQQLLNIHVAEGLVLVTSLAFSPDGKRLAIGCTRDDGLGVWDAATGQRLCATVSDALNPNEIVFNPAGTQLAARIGTTGDTRVAVWDAVTCKPLYSIPSATSPAYSGDGKRLATGGSEIKIWDPTTAEQVQQIEASPGAARCVVFSPDGTHLAAVDDDNGVGVWDAKAGQRVATLKSQTDVVCLTFSPDGRRLAAASGSYPLGNGTVRVWDVVAGSQPRVLKKSGHPSGRFLAFSSDGRRLAAEVKDAPPEHTVRIWDVDTGQLLVAPRSTHSFAGAVFTARGNRLAGWNWNFGIWDCLTGAPVRELDLRISRPPTAIESAREHGLLVEVSEGPTTFAFDPTSGQIATFYEKLDARLWDSMSGKTITTLEKSIAAGRYAKFSADGRLLVAYNEHSIGVWEIPSGKRLQRLNPHHERITAAMIEPNGRRLAITGYQQPLRVWNIDTGELVAEIKGHVQGLIGLNFNSTGKRLATAGFDGKVRLWDTATWRPVLTIHAPGKVGQLTFDPSGDRIAVQSDDGIAIWDGRPLTDAIRAEREAISLVKFLSRRPKSNLPGVLASIRADATITEPVRRQALTLAPRHFQQPSLAGSSD